MFTFSITPSFLHKPHAMAEHACYLSTGKQRQEDPEFEYSLGHHKILSLIDWLID